MVSAPHRVRLSGPQVTHVNLQPLRPTVCAKSPTQHNADTDVRFKPLHLQPSMGLLGSCCSTMVLRCHLHDNMVHGDNHSSTKTEQCMLGPVVSGGGTSLLKGQVDSICPGECWPLDRLLPCPWLRQWEDNGASPEQRVGPKAPWPEMLWDPRRGELAGPVTHHLAQIEHCAGPLRALPSPCRRTVPREGSSPVSLQCPLARKALQT